MHGQKHFDVWMDKRSECYRERYGGVRNIFCAGFYKRGINSPNVSEKNAHNQEKPLQLKFIKVIKTHLQNATYIHVTSTRQVQEQFIYFLSDTAQLKNTGTDESTSSKMSDDKLIEFMSTKLN